MGSPIQRRIFKEGCPTQVRGWAYRKIIDVLKVEIRQAGFGHGRVSSVKEVGMYAKILFEGKMNQLKCRGILVYGDKSTATAYQGRYRWNIIAIEIS